MNDQTEERKRRFEAIPPERIFGRVHLYINEEGEPEGMVAYDGEVLKALNTPLSKALECNALMKLLARYAKQAVNEAGLAALLADLISQDDKEEKSDDSNTKKTRDSTAASGH